MKPPLAFPVLALVAAVEILTLVADVPMSGRAARFDYQSLDTARNRLYISHMRSDQLVVFDTKLRKEIATLEDMPGATGVWSVPELHRVYVSVTGHHHVAIIDDRTLKVVARVGEIGFPDGIAYAPHQNKVYVSDERAGNELVIDAAQDRVAHSVSVGGEAGNTKYDPTSGHVLVAVQTRNDIAVIDPTKDNIVDRFTFPGASQPHGMLVDDGDGLLFVANQGSGVLSVLDLRTHKLLSEHRVGDDPDVLAFDPTRGLLYVAAEAGLVSVFTVKGQTVVHAGDLRLAHAHTVSVDPRDGLVYLPLENVNGHPLLRIMAPSIGGSRR
jgi:DNA-binding beta-propeller fold protein YncE